MKSPARNHGEMAARLRHLRLTFFGDNARAWANFINISYKRWNNFECGYPLSLDAAHHLVRVIPGMTLDYLYYGKIDGLPYELAVRLGLVGGTGGSPRGPKGTTSAGR